MKGGDNMSDDGNGNQKRLAKKSKGSKKSDNGDVRWFNPQPNRADVSDLEDPDYDAISTVIELLTGLPPPDRVQVKYDLRSSRWLALYFRSPDDPDMPLDIMSVRGETAFDAAVLLGYFHLVKFQGEWGGGDDEAVGRFG